MVAQFFRSWGYPGVFPSKMANSEAFECISTVKKQAGSPAKIPHLLTRMIHDIGKTFLPKDLRVFSEHFEDHCFHRSYLMRVRIALNRCLLISGVFFNLQSENFRIMWLKSS